MRVAIVTSQVNYVKDNYESLISYLVNVHGRDVCAIVSVRTLNLNLLLKIIALPFMGAPRLAWNLFCNTIKVLFNSPLRKFEQLGIKIIQTESVNSDECFDALKSLNLDLILNLRTRNIFKERVLNLPRWGCMNIHHGVLPNYRGTMCDLWALSEGRPVGYSIHWMNSKIDDGKILKVREIDPQTKDYSLIPYISSKHEAKDLGELLQEMKVAGKISGYDNTPQRKVYTKNPTVREIKGMRQKGIRL